MKTITLPGGHKKKVFETRPEQLSIGLGVYYYPVIGAHGPKSKPVFTEITSQPWQLGGVYVVKVEGVSGGVDIAHLEIAEK